MRKLICSVVLMLLCAIGAFAADTNTLVLELKSGILEKYELSDKPIITFADSKLCIKSDKVSLSDYAIADVAKYYFEVSGSTAIDELKEAKTSFSFHFKDGEIVQIQGADGASVYTVGGQKVSDVKASEGEINICLSNLPSGVYIIKTNNKSIKIKK